MNFILEQSSFYIFVEIADKVDTRHLSVSV